MSSLFYIKLAATNIRKNSRTYLPYILSGIGMVIMFYNLNFVSNARDIGSDSTSLRAILKMGVVVVGIFSVTFLLYTNSFLIKRRKKEFGLFNILGMEKKHIAKIMLFEILIISFICISAGILAGIILSKLTLLLLYKLISYKVSFGFEVPPVAVLATIALFGLTYFAILLYNVFQVHLSKPIELLRSGNVGEKEPKTKWLMALLGGTSLATGYYIALTVEAPLRALNLFFIAVILVIIGTNFLYKAGSIAVLKILRKNKRYYYKPNHFISVSGMIYRMKRNAEGLANICILSTMVIVMVSTTVSLYIGFEDIIRTRYPRNIVISSGSASDSQVEEIERVIREQTAGLNVEAKNIISYRCAAFVVRQEGEHFSFDSSWTKMDDYIALLTVMDINEYNSLMDSSESLALGQALVYTIKGKLTTDELDLNGYKLKIKRQLDSFSAESTIESYLSRSYVIVVDNDKTIEAINKALSDGKEEKLELEYYYGFDLDADKETQMSLTYTLNEEIRKLIPHNYYVDGVAVSREFFYAVYGGLFYLGIFLGLLFIMETVLIIYYKQITEGYDDKERYEIMQKVGMSRSEVKKTVKDQVLTVFFLPLVTAVVHLAFAFKVITKLLAVLNLTNVGLFAACTAVTIIIFALFYIIVYTVAARSYYKIVSF